MPRLIAIAAFLSFSGSAVFAQSGTVLNSRDHLVSPFLIVSDGDGRMWRQEWSLEPKWTLLPLVELSLPQGTKPIHMASQSPDRSLAVRDDDRAVFVHTGETWESPSFDGEAGSVSWSPDGKSLLIADRSNYKADKQIDIHRFGWKDGSLSAERVHKAIDASQARWADNSRILAERVGQYQATWILTDENLTHSLDYKDNASRRRPGTEIELFARTAWVIDGRTLRGVLGEHEGEKWDLTLPINPEDAIIRVREAGEMNWLFIDNSAVLLSKRGEPLTPLFELPDAPSIIGPTFSKGDASGVHLNLWNDSRLWLMYEDGGLKLKP